MWIRSYLANRKQFVRKSNSASETLFVNFGVLQGSVHEPLLFLIDINYIVGVINPSVDIRLFADDCVLF